MLRVVVVLLAFAVSARAQSPLASKSFEVMLSPGIAPCVIHVNALPVPLAAGTALTARYDWDFGDPGSAYNHLTGWVAAHWYNAPGTYTITLTVTDQAGGVHTYGSHVSIEQNKRWCIYVSPTGSDGNRGLSTDEPVRTPGRASKLLRDDTIVLFQAGGRFDIASAFEVKARDVAFGRYGQGPDPILNRMPGNGGSVFSINSKSDGVVFRHLVFDSPHAVAPEHGNAEKVGVDAIHGGGRNIAIRDCTFLNVDDGLNANGNPVGVLMQDCRAPLVTGLRAYLVWGQGSDHVYLGNTAANSTREHIIRMTGMTRVLIADNDFTNLDRQSIDPHDSAKGTIECHAGSYFYVTHNTLHDGTMRLGPLGVGNDPSTDWCVVDGNTLINTSIPIYTGTHHAMIRNNLIAVDRQIQIQLWGADDKHRVSSDLSIVNNTGIDQGEWGRFLDLGGHVDGVVLRNNLFVAPHLKPFAHTTSAVHLNEPDLASFTAVDHNVWPLLLGNDKTEMLLSGHDNGGYLSASQWQALPLVKNDTFANVQLDEHAQPTADFQAMVRQGVPTAGVWQDRYGQPRPGVADTIGALEPPASGAATRPVIVVPTTQPE